MVREKGFTLIELVIVITIIAIIGSIGGILMGESLRAHRTQVSVSHTASQTQGALMRMSRELRAIRSTSGLTINAHHISFTDTSGNTIAYALSGNQIVRNSRVLADNILDLSFNYLDRNAAVTTSATQTRLIDISITANKDTMQTTLRSLVRPRNLG